MKSILRRLCILGLPVLASCITYSVTPIRVPWVEKPQASAAEETEIAVEIEQTESEEFTANAAQSTNVDNRAYDLALLEYLRAQIEAAPGFRPNPNADFRIHIKSTLPDGSHNSVWVGCLGILTLFVFPVFSSADHKIEVTLQHRGEIIKTYNYEYTTGGSVGWLMIPFNILVTSWVDHLYASTDARKEGIPDLFEWKAQSLNRLIQKDIHSFKNTL